MNSQRECRCMTFVFAKHQHSSEEEVLMLFTRIQERMEIPNEIPNEVMKITFDEAKNSVNNEWLSD